MPIEKEVTSPSERVFKRQKGWWGKRRKERKKLREVEAEEIVDKAFSEKEELKKGWVGFKGFLIERRGYTEEEAKRILEILGMEQ